MIFDFMKTKSFNYIFSFLLGMGLIALFRPGCKGDNCVVIRAPPADEVKTATYQISGKCYQFDTYLLDCPSSGVIEAFALQRV
jgi:hypothetical protein